jgi:uncharacterized protein YecT (DUF1311 family)
MRLRLLLALALALLAPVVARAASFNCSSAQSAREKAICADPALSAADDALAVSYRAAMAPLSAAARAELQAGQRSWLRFIATVCTPVRGAAKLDEAPTPCLRRHYAVRQRQLDRAALASGGRVFARVETFAARPSRDRNRFIERDIAYPQIDQPRGAAEQRWNDAVRQEFERMASAQPGEARDRYIDYHVAISDPRVISLVITDYAYPHGAAHGGARTTAWNWLLDQRRTLAADDLFDQSRGWQAVLAQHAFAQLAQQIEPDMLFAKSADEIRDAVAKPDRWAIERDGIGVLFQEYEVGPYVIGHPEAVVLWRELRPLLTAQPAFAIQPQ